MTPEPAHPRPPERPGWMAIALIAIFVLVAIAMYVVGARMVKRYVLHDALSRP